MTNPELAEVLNDPVFERFTAEDLPVVARRKSQWGVPTQQFADGSELLDLTLLRARALDYGVPVDDDLLPELDAATSTVEPLDTSLRRHAIARTNLFESKVKHDDRAVVRAAEEVVQHGGNYEYSAIVGELDDVVELKAKEKKAFRTKSLLRDFNELFKNLGHDEVWLRVHSLRDDQAELATTRAAQLVGFVLHGDKDHVAIEPVVMGLEGTVGLLPEDVYIDPALHVRVS